MALPVGLLVGAGVAAVAAVFALLERGEAKRQQGEWAKWAKAHEWHHLAESIGVFGDLQAHPFGRGYLRHAANIVTGTWDGVPFTMYHYTYVTGAGRSSRVHNRTVAHYTTRGDFPALVIRHSPTLQRRDIQFESEEFNRAYEVRGDDGRFASAVVHPRFMQALLNGPLAQANVTLERGVVTVWCKDHLMRSSGTRLPRQLAAVVKLIPTHVWADHGAEAPVVTDEGQGPAQGPPLIEAGPVRNTPVTLRKIFQRPGGG